MSITEDSPFGGADADSPDLDSIFAEAAAEARGEETPPETADEPAEDSDSNTEDQGDEVEAPSEGDSPTDADEQMVTVTVDGQEIEVSLSEALKGYQRQADYTRKTQEVARERDRLAAFDALDQAFNEDPVGTIQSLARSVGVELGSGTDNQNGQDAEFDPDDPIARELSDLRAWRQEVEAERQQREMADRQAAVDREIEALKVTFSVPDLDEQALLQFAVEHRIPDLEVAYKAMTYESRAPKSTPKNPALDAKRKAPKVEGGSNRKVGVVPGGNERMSLDDAWASALSEH